MELMGGANRTCWGINKAAPSPRILEKYITRRAKLPGHLEHDFKNKNKGLLEHRVARDVKDDVHLRCRVERDVKDKTRGIERNQMRIVEELGSHLFRRAAYSWDVSTLTRPMENKLPGHHVECDGHPGKEVPV